MTTPDVLMLDRIGGAYTSASILTGGLGGSELEVLQVAQGLTAKGYAVVVANDVETLERRDGVTFVPHAQAWQHPPTKALYLQRFSTPATRLEVPSAVRVIVRANDVYCPPYDVHRPWLASGRATLVANTQWQANQFTFAKRTAVIPPMLEPMPHVKKQKGLFVFASGALKGFEATVARWCAMRQRYPVMQPLQLAIVNPGWGRPRALTDAEVAAGIRLVGTPTPAMYRRWIAKAEGLFMVSTMPETFGCAAALAERAGTRTHILCTAGLGGLAEAVQGQYHITADATVFEDRFLEALGRGSASMPRLPPDLRPSVLIDRWEDMLITAPVTSLAPSFDTDSTLASNQAPLDPFFGEFLSLLRGALTPGGSEYGAGLTLFSLATAIQAKTIVEIGRYKGFSTLALAAACRLQAAGWQEPRASNQRPDVNYAALQGPASVISIDPLPTPDATALIARAQLAQYVDFRDVRSADVTIERPIDLLFIDGGHDLPDVRADVQKFVPLVRPGGYFILHDYFGWFLKGKNGSHIPTVMAESLHGCDRVLIDTGYASLVLFRKAQHLTERWELDPTPPIVPARADGRPTVGALIIAKGEEAGTVATRAIRSAQKIGVDSVTVVVDADAATADLARSLGAHVVIKPSPAIDWEKGIGIIGGARNEALAIAERRTDYLLMIDADDWVEGTLPDRFDHDAYEVTIHDGGLRYQRVQLFRSSLHWRYAGIIHETLNMTSGGNMGRLTSLPYHRGRSSYAFQDQDPAPIKYGKHAHLARKWLLDHPDDSRMQFYLARSLHDAGRKEEALTAYAGRLAMTQGWEEERAYSAFQMGVLQAELGQDPTAALLHAAAIGVPKAEPYVALARWYRDDARRQFTIADLFARKGAEIPPPAVALFTQTWIYQFEAAAEVAICAYWLGHVQEALERFEALLPQVPPERQAWAEQQIAICVQELARR